MEAGAAFAAGVAGSASAGAGNAHTAASAVAKIIFSGWTVCFTLSFLLSAASLSRALFYIRAAVRSNLYMVRRSDLANRGSTPKAKTNDVD